METVSVVFIKKIRSTQSTWMYLTDLGNGTFTAPYGDLTLQIGCVVEHIVSFAGFGFTVVSPQLSAATRQDLEELFPELHFMQLTEHSIMTFFDRAVNQTVSRRRANPNTLYLGSDASGGAESNDGSGYVPAAWCWCSDGVNGGYDFGFSGEVNVNVAEIEGVMQAVIANQDSEANRIHIYCDSSNAVDMFNYDIVEGIVPREARKYGLVGLAEETIQVVRNRRVTVEWVRGHRQHRLNMIADSISRHARKKFSAGYQAEDFVRETDALYSIFNRDR